MYDTLKPVVEKELADIKTAGLYKSERVITSAQGPLINVSGGSPVINLCANNYLGLSNHPKVIQAAKSAMDTHGYGLSSVRFICGTQNIHQQLERKLSEFLGTEDTILYAAAFDANGGLFEPLFNEQDIIISDELNHASIIDGIRLCKAKRERYQHNEMADLQYKLEASKDYRHRIIVTDGAFSMDGTIAQLDKICALAKQYNALVMVDESHCTGFMGQTGRGTHEHHHVMDQVDIITGTLGKALGGASGGFTSGKKEIIDLLRQRSRPYLFSNTLAPAIVGATLTVLEMLQNNSQLKEKLETNTKLFRGQMTAAGFDIPTGIHPLVPVMLYDARIASEFAELLLAEGIYVTAFSYPVVPKDKARIRVQISAAHTKDQLNQAIWAFIKTGKTLKVIR